MPKRKAVKNQINEKEEKVEIVNNNQELEDKNENELILPLKNQHQRKIAHKKSKLEKEENENAENAENENAENKDSIDNELTEPEEDASVYEEKLNRSFSSIGLETKKTIKQKFEIEN